MTAKYSIYAYEDYFHIEIFNGNSEDVCKAVDQLKMVDNKMNVSVVEEREFLTINFKTLECDGSCNGQKSCPYFHSPEEKRRIPMIEDLFNYNAIRCTYATVKNEQCPNMQWCTSCHNDYELNFHPTVYQTSLCPDKYTDVCKNQPWCSYAHECTPEMFYNNDWTDLVTFGANNSLKFIMGAIRGLKKISANRKKKIIIISPSAKYLNIVRSVTLCMSKGNQIKMLLVDENPFDADNYDVYLGTTENIFTHDLNLLNRKDIGALIVENAMKLMEKSVSKLLLSSILQNLNGNPAINKVFVCEIYDPNATECLSAAFKIPLKEVIEFDDCKVRSLIIESELLSKADKEPTEKSKSETSPQRRTISGSQPTPLLYSSLEEEKSLLLSSNKRSRSKSCSNTRNKKRRSISPLNKEVSDSSSRIKKEFRSRSPRKKESYSRSRSRSRSSYGSNGRKRMSSKCRGREIRSRSRCKQISSKFRSKKSFSSGRSDRSESISRRNKSPSRSWSDWSYSTSEREWSFSGSESEWSLSRSESDRSLSTSESDRSLSRCKRDRSHSRSRKDRSLSTSGSDKSISRSPRDTTFSRSRKNRSRRDDSPSGSKKDGSVARSSKNKSISKSRKAKGQSEICKQISLSNSSIEKPHLEEHPLTFHFRSNEKNELISKSQKENGQTNICTQISSSNLSVAKSHLEDQLPRSHSGSNKNKSIYNTREEKGQSNICKQKYDISVSTENFRREDQLPSFQSIDYKSSTSNSPLNAYESRPSASQDYNAATNEKFSVERTIALLEQLIPKFEIAAVAVKEIVRCAREYGVNSSKCLQLFRDEENVILLNIVLDKLKGMLISASPTEMQVYSRAVTWILKLLDYAKIPPQREVNINLKSIAIASKEKGFEFTVSLIKTAFAYEGKQNPTKKEVNEVYLKICAMHLKMMLEYS